MFFYAVFAAYTGDHTFTRWPLLQVVGIRVAAEEMPGSLAARTVRKNVTGRREELSDSRA